MDYYFGDKNYGRDSHLLQVAAKDPERWVAMTEILGFNKMRVLMRGITKIELIQALVRLQKNAPKCYFELSED